MPTVPLVYCIFILVCASVYVVYVRVTPCFHSLHVTATRLSTYQPTHTVSQYPNCCDPTRCFTLASQTWNDINSVFSATNPYQDVDFFLF